MQIEANMGIIMKIPEESESIRMEIDFVDTSGVKRKCVAQFNKDDIDGMRQDFLDNVEFGDDYDAVYVLTDKAEIYLNNA